MLTREATHWQLETLGSLGKGELFPSWKECEPVGFELRTATWLTTGLPAPWKGKVYPGSLASRCQSSRLGAKPRVPAQHEGAEPPFFVGTPWAWAFGIFTVSEVDE